MSTIDKLRLDLIDKILSITNKDYLETLDKLITLDKSKQNIEELTKEQEIMLEMSENDIKSGKLISQDAMIKRNLEWLNAI